MAEISVNPGSTLSVCSDGGKDASPKESLMNERLVSAAGSGDVGSVAHSLRGGGAADENTTKAPSPFGPRESNRKSFNQAKARADAAAVVAQGGAAGSKVGSRRQSLSSQFSTTSTKASNRPGRGSKKKKKIEPQVREILVFDENGKDVTPKPLASFKPTVLSDNPNSKSGPESADSGTQFVDSVPLYSRTGFSVTSTAGEHSPEPQTVEGSVVTDLDDGQESSGTLQGGGSDIVYKSLGRRYPKRKYCIVPAPPVLFSDPREVNKPFAIIISESEHFIMLSMHGRYINDIYANFKEVMERNEKYAQLKEIKLKKPHNYQDNTSQTLFSLLKNKEAQASALSTRSNSVQVNSFDIADTYAGVLPWKVVQDQRQNKPKESDKTKEYSPTPIEVLSPEPFGETDGTPPFFSPPSSRRQSIMASRRGSAVGGRSRRQSRVGLTGVQSRRTSVASRRPSSAGRAQLELGQMSPGPPSGEPPKPAEVDINNIPGLFKALEHVERACVLNTYHDRLLDYRDFRAREIEPPPPEPPPEVGKEGKHKKKKPPVKEDDDDQGPPAANPYAPVLAPFTGRLGGLPKVVLPPLEESTAKVHGIWNYQSDVTDGRNISCMSWNKLNTNLLAVGYGEFEFGTQRDGMIAFWSLKNPRYPNAVITTSSGVTSLDFSFYRPSLLAVGLYSGNVAIYDVQNPKNLDPMAQSSFASGRHADPVWKVEWVDHIAERGEDLISISTDGRVSQWTVKKDIMEFVDLMKLKRVLSQGKGAQPQPFISRRSAGLCFDVWRRDRNIYLVGSEEGPIYKCHRSNKEKYLMTYTGHNGPVYQVRWSPFLESLFLSCSADWTVRLWSEDQEAALLVFETTSTPVADVRWSFTHACVFATASADGHMEIWDLHLSVMKPIVAHTLAPDDESLLSCMMFSAEGPLIFLGGSTGAIYVIKYEGLLKAETDEGELKKLEDTLADVTHHT